MSSRVLRCEECGRRSHGHGRRWRAYLTVDNLVAIFCPSCALREFGLRIDELSQEKE